ncbi:TPA: hypothetical protein DCG86_03190, partial [Candidatus Marinimicrobia bacterium]
MRDIFLEGEKVILTPMEEEDAEFIRKMENDPEVRYALFLYKPLTRESAEKQVREMISSHDIFMFM